MLPCVLLKSTSNLHFHWTLLTWNYWRRESLALFQLTASTIFENLTTELTIDRISQIKSCIASLGSRRWSDYQEFLLARAVVIHVSTSVWPSYPPEASRPSRPSSTSQPQEGVPIHSFCFARVFPSPPSTRKVGSSRPQQIMISMNSMVTPLCWTTALIYANCPHFRQGVASEEVNLLVSRNHFVEVGLIHDSDQATS